MRITGQVISSMMFFGRLSLVRDQDKNILKRYAITIRAAEDWVPFFNTVQNQNFTRNNCASVYVNSTVTYTVPANTYSSTVSQAEVNLFAQADINSKLSGPHAILNGTSAHLLPATPVTVPVMIKIQSKRHVCAVPGYWACIKRCAVRTGV